MTCFYVCRQAQKYSDPFVVRNKPSLCASYEYPHLYFLSLFYVIVCADVIFSRRLQIRQRFRVMTFCLVCKLVERRRGRGPYLTRKRKRKGMCLTGVTCICHPRSRHVIHLRSLSSNCQHGARTPLTTSFLSSSLHSVIDFLLARYDYSC